MGGGRLFPCAFKLRRTPVFCRSLLAGDFTFHRLTTSWVARKQAPTSRQISLILEANWNYQVINCGNYRRDLFASKVSAQWFQTWLCAAAERFGWRIHAFVVMRNQRSENPAGELPAGFLPLPRLRLRVATQFAHGQPLRARGTQPQARLHLREAVREELNHWTKHRSCAEAVRRVKRITRGWSNTDHYGHSTRVFGWPASPAAKPRAVVAVAAG